jgi:predicted P-loop ATPase
MATLDNIKAYIAYAKITGRYNTVTNNLEIQLSTKLKTIVDTNDPKMVSYLVDSEMMKHGTRDGTVRQKAKGLLVTMAAETIYNPIVEHFTKTLKPWDKTTRIPQLMGTIDCDKHDISQYTVYVRKWLIQVMAAVFTTYDRPNRLNNVLILQGEQGVGKTMWVESLFPPALQRYCVGSKSVNMSQFRNDMVKLGMELTNTLICNINEIDTVFSPKTYSEFKQFLDKTVDKVVLPYGSSSTDVLRRTVFIGSTNRYQLFSDTTGNRRFMLINAVSFDFKHNIDLDQLWAEAYYYYTQGETWWLDDESVLAQQRETNNAALDGMDENIIDKLNNMFDTTHTDYKTWETYTFPRLSTLLSLNMARNSSEHRAAKRTVTFWLSLIMPGVDLVKIPKNQGTAWSCHLPRLKIEG